MLEVILGDLLWFGHQATRFRVYVGSPEIEQDICNENEFQKKVCDEERSQVVVRFECHVKREHYRQVSDKQEYRPIPNETHPSKMEKHE